MPGQYGFQQPSTVVVQGGFDAGARFDVTGPTLPVRIFLINYAFSFVQFVIIILSLFNILK